jgi:hypothetical protein
LAKLNLEYYVRKKSRENKIRFSRKAEIGLVSKLEGKKKKFQQHLED